MLRGRLAVTVGDRLLPGLLLRGRLSFGGVRLLPGLVLPIGWRPGGGSAILQLLRPPGWLPNAVSGLRIALLPVWGGVLYGLDHPDRGWALAILVALGLSDVLDGFLARRLKLESELGATLDAIADKTAQILVFTLLALVPLEGFFRVPLWFVGLLVLRDCTMVVGLIWIWRRRHLLQVEHHRHGKVVSFALFLLMLGVHLPPTPPWISVGVVLVALLVAWSTGLYVRDGVRVLRGRLPLAPSPE